MSQKPKAIFSWSGGKDSAMCLHRVRQQGVYEIVFLLTTLNRTFSRVSMHGVREELLDAQAASLGLPLEKVWVSEGTNEEYERQMEQLLLKAKEAGINTMIFGDIFLADLRAYREQNLAKVGMQAVFPLWKEDTQVLSRYFVETGFKAITCCVQDVPMGEQRVGCELTQEFFADLPPNTDPCGENGEYHTFCYDGPVFAYPVVFTIGERVYRALDVATNDAGVVCKGFWYCDLLLT